MASCERLGGCLFFNDKMENMPTMTSMYKSKYCMGDATTCARNVVASVLGAPAVPVSLYPNDMDEAKRVITAANAQ